MPENEESAIKEESPKTTLEDYKQMLAMGELDLLQSQEALAEILGVHRNTISAWNKKIDWACILQERRKSYSSKFARVDESMFKAAVQKGDVQAARYLAERFDGYTPTEKRLNQDINKSDADILKELEELRTKQNVNGIATQGTGITANPSLPQ